MSFHSLQVQLQLPNLDVFTRIDIISSDMSAKVDCDAGRKSVIWAYVLWLFGGIFGVHHFYLRRDRHAFVWWTTLGGFGVGWLGEIFRIPRYVRDANEDHPQELKARMQQNKKVSMLKF